MYDLGVDIGYSSVKTALVDKDGRVLRSGYALHKGHAARTLKGMLADLAGTYGPDAVSHGAATGSGAVLLTGPGLVRSVNEVAALVEGTLVLAPEARSVVEMGGQSAKYVTGFTFGNKSRMEVSINSSCASGTGSFLEEQVSRLGLDIEDFSALAGRAGSIPRIAGRCSVFAKTDIVHHQQEGVPKEDILLGLAHAVARNYRSAVMRKLSRKLPILFAGGVARNSAIVSALREILKLSSEELVLHEHSAVAGAVGAAVLARKNRLVLDLAALTADLPENASPPCPVREDTLELPPLAGFGVDDASGKHDQADLDGGRGPVPCWLGIDVGSTSTNLVLSDARDRILAHLYLRTAGDPVGAVRRGLGLFNENPGPAVAVQGVAATGSGRYMIGRLVGADLVRDEITAQARAAVAIDPRVDTVFEIGGQDSKFIALKSGVVTDFQMNKVCAAGTGSFIEEQAKKLDISLEDFPSLALAAPRPVNLGERCTVFMEAGVAAHLARGESLENIAAGLCYSIVKNYMNRVVGGKRVGKAIFLQGGLGYNQGVVNAFRALTGREVTVPPFFSVTGAYGAAILAREETSGREEGTAFKGFFPPEEDKEARRASTPGQGGREDFNKRIGDLVFKGYDGTLNPDRKTVGIPRALFTFGMFPMFGPFFQALGLNVLMSSPTSEETVRLAQDYSLDETCYPVKLINGHVAELVARGVDYIFFPDLYTVFHPGSKSRQDYGCAYMQVAFKIINQAMDLDSKGITLLAPTIAFNQGPEFMRQGFMKLGHMLGRSDQETGLALQAAMQSFQAFEAELGERARRTLENIVPGKKTFVLISKIYGVADQALNMGIPAKLAEMGYDVLAFPELPEADIFNLHPNMYWPFGQHILEAAEQVKRHPDLYAVFLTHHGCGPDTVLSHYFREIMGSKPYLAIEVDEHSSGVGVTTRVEAFVNSLEKTRPANPGPANPGPANPGPADPGLRAVGEDEQVCILAGPGDLEPGTIMHLPRLFPYAELVRTMLAGRGLDARLVPGTTQASIDAGRRHTVTNEYFSMAALLGDVLTALGRDDAGRPRAVLLPRNQGAETDGQYARFLRCKLDANGFGDVAVVSPFMEDLADMGDRDAEDLFFSLLAGDVILSVPGDRRSGLLDEALQRIRGGVSTRGGLEALAIRARREMQPLRKSNGAKTVFAVGEPLVLYNDLLNDHVFQGLERAGHRVIRAPLGECLWTFWMDHLEYDRPVNGQRLRGLLDRLADLMGTVSRALGVFTPYADDPEDLRRVADKSIGLYAGAFGRYRTARALVPPEAAQGLITVASMYENTGISLGILHKGLARRSAIPWLNLTFDGTGNENDRTKTESFIYFL